MVFRRILAALPPAILAAIALAATVEAYVRAGPGVMHGYHRLMTPIGTVSGVGAPPADAYSFRRVISGYAGPAVKLRRASDTTTLDIGFVGSAFDITARNTFCAATTCSDDTWYSQTPSARHLVQPTAASQPADVASCNGALQCLRTTGNTQTMASVANVTPATGVLTLNAVANRSVGTGACNFIRQAGTGQQRITGNTAASQWVMSGGSGTNVVTAADSVWHSAIAVFASPSSASLISIDGTETTGTVAGGLTPGTVQILGAASSTCSWGEVLIWDNYVLSAAERAALIANQRAAGLIP